MTETESNDIVGLLPHRACRNCVQIKVKCIPKEGAHQTICQRCFRLKKQCTTAAPIARKRRKITNSKVAQLEHRINQLSTLLVSPTSVAQDNNEDIANSVLPSMRHPPSRSITAVSRESLPCHTDDHVSEAHYTRAHSHITSSSIIGGYDDALARMVQAPSPPTTSEGPSTVNRDYASPEKSDEHADENTSGHFVHGHLLDAACGPVNEPYRGFSCSSKDVAIGHSSSEAGREPSTSEAKLDCPFSGVLPKKDVSGIDFCPLFLDPKLEHELFNTFQESMSCFFPFVVLEPAVSISKMKCERPFLFWACIVAASHHHRTMHRRLNEEMLKGIGEYVLLRGTKSLDLLQGILVLLAWYHYYAHMNPQSMNLIVLAQAMVVDLGLTIPPIGMHRNHLAADAAELMHGRKVNVGLTTNDERRALLGCYVLTAKVSMCFRRLEPMRYTKHMHDCFQVLKNQNEIDSDTTLLQFVELTRIVGKYIKQEFSTIKMPFQIHAKMFEDEIRQYEASLPAPSRKNTYLVAEIKSCRVCFYEPTQLDEYSSPLERAEALHACLSAVEDFFRCFLSLPNEQIANVTFGTWLSKMHSLTVLGQLSFLNIDGWDIQYVRTRHNLATIMQEIADKFMAVNSYHAKNMPERMPWRFAVYAERMRRIKAWFEAKVNAERANIQTSAIEMNNSIPDVVSTSLFDFELDDALWRDIMGDFTNF